MNKASLYPQHWTETLAGVALLVLISGFIGLGPNPAIAQGDLDALGSEAVTAGSIERTARLTPAVPTTCSQSYITCGILFALNWLVDMVINIVYPLVEQLFTAMLSENLTAFANGRALIAAEVGWRIVLGIVNMFFVLLLLWIAIATIFDFSMFSARSLLPKLIIMALLINFSFAIGKSIINLSNGIGNIFYEQIKRQGGPAAAVKKMFDMKTMTMGIQNQYVSLNPEEARQKLIDARVTLQRGITPLGIIDIPLGGRTEWTALDCYNEVYALPSFLGGLAYLSQAWIFQEWTYNQCNALLKNVEISQALAAIDPTIGSEILLAGAFIAKAFMVPIVLFVLFAGAIMFLVRLISLMGLLIFAPFAFLSFIIPGMGNFWSGWWNKLFKWSFFLPAFLFLFMLSLLVVQGIPIETQRAILAGQAVPNLSRLMLDYAVGIGLMIFALLVGNQMSIYGASAVVGMGKRWSKATGGYVKARGWKYAGKVAETAAPITSRIPGLRQATTAVMTRGAKVEKKDIEFYTRLPDRQLGTMLSGMPTGKRQAILGALPAKRKIKFTPEGQLATAPPPAAPHTPVTPRELQVQVLPIVQGLQAIQNLPQAVREAIAEGINRTIQERPGASPSEIATAVQETVNSTVRIHPETTAEQREQIKIAIQAQAPNIQRVVEQSRRPAVPSRPSRPPMREEFEEEIESLKDEIEELRERK